MKYDYKRVIIIGVDGAGDFFKDADTPNIDRIFANGAVCHDALTSIPTISAECWGSMLLGVTPEVHGLTNGSLDIPYDTKSVFPSVFRVTREKYPDAKLASFCNWNPINTGIVENGIDVFKDTSGDKELSSKICNYIKENDFTLIFIQFDEVDGAGHGNGYGTPGHLAKIAETDVYVGDIYNALEESGQLEDTLIILSADHGGTPQGGHGGTTDAEKIIFIAFAGKTVNKCELCELEVRDIAAITVCALGEEQPVSWTARVPKGLFCDYEGGGERPAGMPKQ